MEAVQVSETRLSVACSEKTTCISTNRHESNYGLYVCVSIAASGVRWIATIMAVRRTNLTIRMALMVTLSRFPVSDWRTTRMSGRWELTLNWKNAGHRCSRACDDFLLLVLTETWSHREA